MEALEEMAEKGKGALPAITTCLKDPSPLVRIMAARALYHIGGDVEPSLRVFIEAMSKPELDVRRQAIAEIEQLFWSRRILGAIESLHVPNRPLHWQMNTLHRMRSSNREWIEGWVQS